MIVKKLSVRDAGRSGTSGRFSGASAGRAVSVTWICSGNAPTSVVVAIGGTSVDAEAAVLEVFEEHDLIADLYLPSALYPPWR
ncbi:MAG: hypothetical protein IPP17_31275 [Bacteroidetes bacterium]|nr:hypothetical protein [Bacteroidota bacterium]